MQSQSQSQSQANSCESSNSPSLRNPSCLVSLLSFHCPHCSKGFPSSQSLRRHQKAHRKERNALRKRLIQYRKLKAQARARGKGKSPLFPSARVLKPRPIRVAPIPLPPSEDGIRIPQNAHFGFRFDMLSCPSVSNVIENNSEIASLSELQKFLAFQSFLASPNFVSPFSAANMVSGQQINLNNECHVKIPDKEKVTMEWEADYEKDEEDDDDDTDTDTDTDDEDDDDDEADYDEDEDGDEGDHAWTDNGDKGKEKVTFEKQLDLTLKL
ncbi:hypothetical protein JCGZ_12763 [Jatropha curcas]|uniref:C2H2-type domain-containing protein n=1 Tax=Jatropha curcas TaxID=180498 RepID=A0A067KQA5_JATCU|nr:hypothetical protein JCGZ_12763 [Jatropha curcas]